MTIACQVLNLFVCLGCFLYVYSLVQRFIIWCLFVSLLLWVFFSWFVYLYVFLFVCLFVNYESVCQVFTIIGAFYTKQPSDWTGPPVCSLRWGSKTWRSKVGSDQRGGDYGTKLILIVLIFFCLQVYRQTVVLGLQMAAHFVILATSIAALIFLWFELAMKSITELFSLQVLLLGRELASSSFLLLHILWIASWPF